MSRIGRRPVVIPEGVSVVLENNRITVKGPKGELSWSYDPTKVEIKIEDLQVKVIPLRKNLKVGRAYWGLARSLINNMVIGVSKGFEKKLVVEGVGYRANLQGNKLVLNIGYSRPVEMEIPSELIVSVKDNVITVSGIDKYLVGQFAALIREKREPDAYKGKGIRYFDERLKLKVGKAGV